MLDILSVHQREPCKLGPRCALGRAEDLCPTQVQGAVSFPILVAASLGFLLALSKPPPDLWVSAAGPFVWTPGS